MTTTKHSESLLPGVGPSVIGIRHRMVEYRAFNTVRALVDLSAVFVAFAASYYVYAQLIEIRLLSRTAPGSFRYVLVGLLFGSILLATFWRLGLYKQRASVLNLWELGTAVKGIAVASAFLFAFLFFLKLEGYSRLVVVGGIGFATAVILLERRILSAFLRKLQLSGRLGRRVLIYGCGETGQLLMKKIAQAPHIGCTVVGFVDNAAPVGNSVTCRITQRSGEVFSARILGRLDQLEALASLHRVDEVLVAEPSVDSGQLQQIIDLCRALDLKVGIVPHLGDVRADQVTVEDLSAVPLLRPQSSGPGKLYLATKRVLDVCIALPLLVLTAPTWLLAVVAIRLGSPGPALFAQDRVGLGDRRFRMFKFRTMRHDVEPYAQAPSTQDDPRITRVGRILRISGFDELPQLINVLRGEMTLVGPRPEMPFIVERYTGFEHLRLGVKPGIVGLWQLSADRHAEIHENIEYDLYYLRHQSVLLDALILLETVFFTLGVILHSLRLRRSEVRTGKAEKYSGRSRPLPAFKPVIATSEGPRALEPNYRPAAEADAKPYVFVALDQRSSAGYPISWGTCLPTLRMVSNHLPIKILVASNNRPTFDDLLKRSGGRVRARSHLIGYAPYQGGSELRALTIGATLVITDLPHVEVWAHAAGIDAVRVQANGVVEHSDSRSGGLAAELTRRFSRIQPRSAAAAE